MTAAEALSPHPVSGSRCARRCRRRIEKGGFDPLHEDLRLAWPRHANDSLFWQTPPCGYIRRERYHQHISNVQVALPPVPNTTLPSLATGSPSVCPPVPVVVEA
jgi:hypothetical protein